MAALYLVVMAQLKYCPLRRKSIWLRAVGGSVPSIYILDQRRLVGDPQVRIGRKRLVCGRFFVSSKIVEVSGIEPESKEKCVSVSTLRRTSGFV